MVMVLMVVMGRVPVNCELVNLDMTILFFLKSGVGYIFFIILSTIDILFILQIITFLCGSLCTEAD